MIYQGDHDLVSRVLGTGFAFGKFLELLLCHCISNTYNNGSVLGDCVQHRLQNIAHGAATQQNNTAPHGIAQAPHTAHSTPHTAHSTQHPAHNTQHTAHSTQHTAHRTPHTAHSTQHSTDTTHSTEHTAHCTQHTTHRTQHTSHSTQHTAHSIAAAPFTVVMMRCSYGFESTSSRALISS
jgi:methyl-accepting chemotaxis protein